MICTRYTFLSVNARYPWCFVSTPILDFCIRSKLLCAAATEIIFKIKQCVYTICVTLLVFTDKRLKTRRRTAQPARRHAWRTFRTRWHWTALCTCLRVKTNRTALRDCEIVSHFTMFKITRLIYTEIENYFAITLPAECWKLSWTEKLKDGEGFRRAKETTSFLWQLKKGDIN